jgi:acetyl esterase/lipase
MHEVRVDDVPYAMPEGETLLARIYAPANGGPFPAVVDVHGGAWSNFDRTVDAQYAEALAARGIVVVALDFRQAPRHRFPSAAADVVAGVRFVRRHAERYRVRPDAIGLLGGSSGGHLALLAALRPDAPELASTPWIREMETVGDPGPSVAVRVAFVLALWPIADPLARYRYLLERIANLRPPASRFFLPERLKAGHDAFFGDEATMHRASVPRLLDDGEAQHLPPLWVAHPELDDNVTLAMTRALVDAYRRAGGDVELVVYPGVGHAFANFPGETTDRCIDAMAAFISSRAPGR